ncbi:hypothetical protein EDB83DRAFT_2321557 [Lactarius deliciosus]|nr:hypothetical protein EDB83DRAFT_2321557 [Lactarius deliciosus]
MARLRRLATRFTGDEVNNVLKGALVELHFELHHYHIRIKESNTNFDCFNATIEQIIILQTSAARPSSAYKRKNIGQGPIRMVSAAALHRTRDSDTDEGSQLGGPSSGVLPFPNGEKENQEHNSLDDSEDDMRQGKKKRTD